MGGVAQRRGLDSLGLLPSEARRHRGGSFVTKPRDRARDIRGLNTFAVLILAAAVIACSGSADDAGRPAWSETDGGHDDEASDDRGGAA